MLLLLLKTKCRAKMVYPKRIHVGSRENAMQCVKCAVKTGTFLFWASLYMLVMKLTIFKTSVKTPTEDWLDASDNYTKWMVIVVLNKFGFGKYLLSVFYLL